jgi:tetratricopeptide (TPR) repeat protein
MKSILNDTRRTFEEFFADPSQNTLIVCTETEDSVLLLKTLSSMEEEPASPDIFLMFGHEFIGQSEYVSEVITRIEEQISDLNGELAKNNECFQALPETAVDEAAEPAARLVASVHHIRSNVPRSSKLICLFFPMAFKAGESDFAQLMESLKRQTDESGITGCKFIVRDEPSRVLCRQYNNDLSVRIYFPFLDLASINARLKEQANDPTVSPDEQAQAHMLLAGFDVAEGRHDQALQRNTELLGYFYYTKQRQQQSVVLCNIGDIHYVQERFPEAQDAYEQALTIAIEERAQPLMIYQSINLGNALIMQQKFEEALVYYDSAEKLAEANKAILHQVQALERSGHCMRQQGRMDDAIARWERAAEICRQFQYTYGLKTILERLVQAYEVRGMIEERDERQREADDLDREPDSSDLSVAASPGH